VLPGFLSNLTKYVRPVAGEEGGAAATSRPHCAFFDNESMHIAISNDELAAGRFSVESPPTVPLHTDFSLAADFRVTQYP
jgi:hypothetical protein